MQGPLYPGFSEEPMRKYQQWWENELNRCACVCIIHTYRDLWFLMHISSNLSVDTVTEIAPTSALCPSHVKSSDSNICFIPKTKTQNIYYTCYITFKIKRFHTQSFGTAEVTEFCSQAASTLTYSFLLCCREGCSHSSVPDIPILLSPAILYLLPSCIHSLTRD